MNSIAARLLIVAALVGAAFGAGYYTKGRFDVADQVDETKTAITQSAENVMVATKESARIEADVAKVDSNISTIKAAIVKRGVTLQPKEHTHASSASPVPGDSLGTNGSDSDATAAKNASCEAAPDGGDRYVLDLATVRMLNAARQGRGLDAAGSSDEAQSAPSTVGMTQFITNDLDIVQMYLELAKRHDELVDAVEKKLQDQAR